MSGSSQSIHGAPSAPLYPQYHVAYGTPLYQQQPLPQSNPSPHHPSWGYSRNDCYSVSRREQATRANVLYRAEAQRCMEWLGSAPQIRELTSEVQKVLRRNHARKFGVDFFRPKVAAFQLNLDEDRARVALTELGWAGISTNKRGNYLWAEKLTVNHMMGVAHLETFQKVVAIELACYLKGSSNYCPQQTLILACPVCRLS